MAAHITDEHRRAFEALTSGRYENFCHFSCTCDGQPAAAIAALTATSPADDGAQPEYVITPMCVSVTPGMKLVDHDGREA